MYKPFKKLSALSCITSSIFLSTPVFSAITIDISVATDGNTPEAAVANILSDPTGVCNKLLNSEGELNSDQVYMLGFCNDLNAADQTTTGPAYTALSARSFTAINSYAANSFTSFDIGDIAKRLAALRRSASISTNKTAAFFNSTPISTQLSSIDGSKLPSGGGASADSPGGLNDNRLSGFITGTFDDATQDETSTVAG